MAMERNIADSERGRKSDEVGAGEIHWNGSLDNMPERKSLWTALGFIIDEKEFQLESACSAVDLEEDWAVKEEEELLPTSSRRRSRGASKPRNDGGGSGGDRRHDGGVITIMAMERNIADSERGRKSDEIGAGEIHWNGSLDNMPERKSLWTALGFIIDEVLLIYSSLAEAIGVKLTVTCSTTKNRNRLRDITFPTSRRLSTMFFRRKIVVASTDPKTELRKLWMKIHGYGMGPGSEWSTENWPRSPGEMIRATVLLAGRAGSCHRRVDRQHGRARQVSWLVSWPSLPASRPATRSCSPGELARVMVELAGRSVLAISFLGF
ncbi:hypothetical protein F2Q70_00031037 [Brassica cretica]|uniref:Uncharacterized protein n=1 Tax=Brassica cretica TaxID=69181 RepID=A0A8S9FFR7_BRACR|nr:hypothetical protein F2Q70_00031037 [Brassica cretica]